VASFVIVEDFVFDEQNESEIADHGITPEELIEVLEGPHRTKRNRRQRRASHMVIGRNSQGQCLAIPIELTHDPRIWRPVTAWLCKPHEWGWLPRAK
jgi:uncharacterized DUF497 family protein